MTRKTPVQKKKMVRTTPITPVLKVNKAGRTGYYKPEFADKAEELVGKLGAGNKELALAFNVALGTIEYWMRTKDDFRLAVCSGRVNKGLKVGQALYQRAIGYSHPDVHIMSQKKKIFDDEGKLLEEITVPLIIPITKHYPPDTQAAIKILSILHREVWAENINVNHNVQGNINIKKVEELSMDDLNDEMKQMLFAINMKQLSDGQHN